MEITVKVPVSKATLRDLLVCALEGGSNYWVGPITVGSFERSYPRLNWYEEVFEKNGTFLLEDQFGDSQAEMIDYERGVNALEHMLKECPHLIDDYLSDNMDADFADLWLQYACYGKCVYS